MKQRLSTAYRPLLHLVHRGLPDGILACISSLIETRSIVASKSAINAISGYHSFPPEAAFPLLLADLLPSDCNRVLFLDADLLVLDDVSSLWERSLHGRAVGAVQDPAIPYCRSPRGVKKRTEFGVPKNARYFNGGVLLLDLAVWRERDVARRALAYLQSVGPAADFLHQEALNAVLWNDWMPIESRWNLVASLAGRRYGPSDDGWRNPGIVHYAGRFKPWRARVGGPFDAPYRAFFEQAAISIPPVKAGTQAKLLSFYDRHLRNFTYTFERILWNRRLI